MSQSSSQQDASTPTVDWAKVVPWKMLHMNILFVDEAYDPQEKIYDALIWQHFGMLTTFRDLKFLGEDRW